MVIIIQNMVVLSRTYYALVILSSKISTRPITPPPAPSHHLNTCKPQPHHTTAAIVSKMWQNKTCLPELVLQGKLR